ncbi:MAG: nucleotidyl transferase AbiEii/AbiGii toxin family protein [Spirochaetes bacterium]|nr:nucleotidyl transferase AbiEii/AbiGii toxin family protein [Spirochaetota bacterium]MCK5266627.1 nucleotidyl transferase AbiEii/AbiGii toxin family protein [Spirochaetota bacterium]
MSDYLHNHPEFKELLRAVEHEKSIDSSLIEKDYWIMHVLYGLQKGGFEFELKGGTSLSKGYGIIHRFSEDIDIRIEPPAEMDVMDKKDHDKPQHCESRRQYYDWLAENIEIDGIENIERDTEFDNEKYTSAGIRLHYKDAFPIVGGLKEGVLLEVGFDEVTPNDSLTISSWALDFAQKNDMEVVDNKACDVKCYHPGYTFVEKLQTIATKFRQQQKTGKMPSSFIRHYYDVACLLDNGTVQEFIGTEKYKKHKIDRFPRKEKELPLSKQEAFQLNDPEIRDQFEKEYNKTAALYYQGQISLDDILKKISENLDKL